MKKTAVVWDARYLEHDTGAGHPESPQRLLAVKEVLDVHGNLVWLPPRIATEEEISSVHTREHIAEVNKTRLKAHSWFDQDTPVSSRSAEAAFLSAGGVLTAVEDVFSKKISNAFVFPRPPGHHAESNRAMGFCLFNNVAIAAEYLIRKKNLGRVAIVDIDVHHGNGTQNFFYDRKDVFYISSHRYPFYPGTGAEEEKGRGVGLGYTLNLPYPALSDDDDYQKGYEEKILPALLDYKPEFVLVSAGFDAHIRDPLGGMKITKKGFVMMSRLLFKIANQCSGGKIVFVLEGGYDKKGLQEGVEGVLEVIQSNQKS